MRKPGTIHRTAMLLAGSLMIGFAGLSLWHGGRIAWADADSLASRWTLNAWRDGRGPATTPELWEQTRDDLISARQLTPDNAQLHDDLAYLYASRAQAMGWPKADSPEEAVRQGLLTDAIASYRAATGLRPTFPYSWAYLALAKHFQGQQDAEFWTAFDKALQYGVYVAGVQPTLAYLAFAQWTTLTPERRERVTTMVISAKGSTKKQLVNMAAKSGIVVPGLQDPTLPAL